MSAKIDILCKKIMRLCKWWTSIAFDCDLVVPGKEKFGNRCHSERTCNVFFHYKVMFVFS